MTHSIVSPSSSFRWLKCTASLVKESKYPSQPNVYSETGSSIHEVAEKVLLGEKVENFLNKTVNNIFIDQSMIDIVNIYTGYVRKHLNKHSDMYIEEKVYFKELHPDGFGTIDCVIVKNNILHIMDLKCGKNKVDVRNNSQLMIYALGFLEEYDFLYDIRKVFIHIIQPKIDNIAKKEVSMYALFEFHKHVKKQLEECFSNDPIYKYGSHCYFCKAKMDCGTYIDRNRPYNEDDLFGMLD